MFWLEAENLRANNWGASVKREYIPDKGFVLAVNLAHVGYLNDGVILCSWKFTFFWKALYIKREYTQWRYLRELAVAFRVEYHFRVIINIELQLACSFFLAFRADAVSASFNIDPTHPHHLIVYHEAKTIRQVWLICGCPKCTPIECDTFFDVHAEMSYLLIQLHEDFNKFGVAFAVVHDGLFLHNFKISDLASATEF